MSVTFRQNVTVYPLAFSQRTQMSKLTPDLTCPMCGGACTVAPHRYSDAFPGMSGEKSRIGGWRCRRDGASRRQGYR